ncbi:MAG: transporter substrate-binding domain-containing protein [Legionellaceae bacterium]|nr:transporter substrate-binding domain-containing protein [Legionellaceae bacterium]
MSTAIKTLFAALLLLQTHISRAEPLEIMVNGDAAPYVMMTGNNVFHGFDIDMMLYLCKVMNRECSFRSAPFDQIINAVATGAVQLAVSGITITRARADRVNFTQPYLPSLCSYLGKSNIRGVDPNLSFLEQQRFGIVSGTIFGDIIRSSGVTNARITTYNDTHTLIDALYRGNISLVLLDKPSALYWQARGKGTFTIVGKPFPCGLGMAIAVNPQNTSLLNELNHAITQYARSELYQTHRRLYMSGEISEHPITSMGASPKYPAS